MSMAMEDEIKRWTAKRKSALVLDIIQGKTTVAEASRAYDLPPSEIEKWIDEGKRGWRTPCELAHKMCGSSTSSSRRNSRKPMGRRCWSCVREKLQSLLGEDES